MSTERLDQFPSRLEDYPYSVAIGPRFRETDRNGHLNNGAITDMFETARVLFDRELGRQAIVGADPVVALVSIKVDFRTEAFFPEPLQIGCAVSDLGRTSWTMVQIAHQHGAAVAHCRAVLVHLLAGKALPISNEWKAKLATMSRPDGS